MAEQSTETRMSFQLRCTYNPNKSLCQDACENLKLNPYIIASRTRRSVEHGTRALTALG